METNYSERSRKICFIWGGLGATVPTMLAVATVDWAKIAEYLSDESGLSLMGYGFRIIAFFVVGGLWAYMHKSEYEPVKLFQLGIIAPSLIVGMISGNNVQLERNDEQAFTSNFSISIISPAHAQEDKPKKKDGGSSEGTVRKIVKGFLGQ